MVFVWGHWDDDVGEDAVVPACRGFLSVPGPLQSVQRAEMWGGHFTLADLSCCSPWC